MRERKPFRLTLFLPIRLQREMAEKYLKRYLKVSFARLGKSDRACVANQDHDVSDGDTFLVHENEA